MKNNTILIIVLILIIIVSLFTLVRWQQSSIKTSSANKLIITTSFYPLYFFTSQIGGDQVEIINITPAGAEPHDYEPTPQDLTRIENSQLLVLNGRGLEIWGNKAKENLKDKPITIVEVEADLMNQEIDEESKTVQDPHVWLAPPLAKKEAQKIAEALIKVDSTHKNTYTENTSKLMIQLDELDTKYKQGLTNCQQKDFVTSHAAFGYLAKTYSLNQVSISGLSPDEEPSPQKLAEVAEFAKAHQISYIFFESLVSPKFSQTIAKEVGAKTLVLNPLEGLTPEEINAGATYFTVMKENLVNLRTALQCQ